MSMASSDSWGMGSPGLSRPATHLTLNDHNFRESFPGPKYSCFRGGKERSMKLVCTVCPFQPHGFAFKDSTSSQHDSEHIASLWDLYRLYDHYLLINAPLSFT